MSECIDCLHYEACKDIHDILDTACRGEFDYEALARGCKNFTDRSEWVHLLYPLTSIGKTVSAIKSSPCSIIAFNKFLTREEAEKELEKMK